MDFMQLMHTIIPHATNPKNTNAGAYQCPQTSLFLLAHNVTTFKVCENCVETLNQNFKSGKKQEKIQHRWFSISRITINNLFAFCKCLKKMRKRILEGLSYSVKNQYIWRIFENGWYDKRDAKGCIRAGGKNLAAAIRMSAKENLCLHPTTHHKQLY